MVVIQRGRARPCRWPERRVIAGLSLAAALLSAAYLGFYLRGGPRIIDATSYLLQAKTFAAGMWAFPVPEPSASFRGRFLVSAAGQETLSVIFPPGYAALLAAGARLGFPLLMGPLCGAALVWATWALARELSGRRDVAITAGVLSVFSAALRYHTADTMSHGWAALLVTLTLYLALRAGSRWSLLSGLACGWLIATRPATGSVLCVSAAVLCLQRRPGAVLALVAGILPGAVLLLLHQHAITGQWLLPSQLRYYQLSDGPPGCFGWGLGARGCTYEHGDFVRAMLPNGFGIREAIAISWTRVHHHLRDATNLQLLAPLGLIPLVNARRAPWVLVPSGIILGVILVYGPFYYGASYPGGGARLYADVIPLEHVILAQGSVLLGVQRYIAPAMLLGYAVQTSFDHVALREREGGRPMFEPEVVRRAGVETGLVFVSTDHGFNLGFQPGALDPGASLLVARLREDAHDWQLWNRTGRPPAYRYEYDPFIRGAAPRLLPYQPRPSFRFESEAQWPLLDVEGGWAHPEFSRAGCSSRGRGLQLRPDRGRRLRIRLEVTAPQAGHYAITAGWETVTRTNTNVSLALGSERSGMQVPAVRTCWESPALDVFLAAGTHPLSIQAEGGNVLLDYLECKPASPPIPPRRHLSTRGGETETDMSGPLVRKRR